jgi:hypothetical protein
MASSENKVVIVSYLRIYRKKYFKGGKVIANLAVYLELGN